MSKILKIYFIISLWSFFYFIVLFNNVEININILNFIIHKVHIINLIIIVIIIGILLKNRILYFSVFIKIVIFISLFMFYFIFEQIIIKISIYSIGDSGGWIRHNIYEDINYIFQWYEVLFWNFIFSLHYPIYIFIFFKPFVNHLDKSIRKIKDKENKN